MRDPYCPASSTPSIQQDDTALQDQGNIKEESRIHQRRFNEGTIKECTSTDRFRRNRSTPLPCLTIVGDPAQRRCRPTTSDARAGRKARSISAGANTRRMVPPLHQPVQSDCLQTPGDFPKVNRAGRGVDRPIVGLCIVRGCGGLTIQFATISKVHCASDMVQ